MGNSKSKSKKKEEQKHCYVGPSRDCSRRTKEIDMQLSFQICSEAELQKQTIEPYLKEFLDSLKKEQPNIELHKTEDFLDAIIGDYTPFVYVKFWVDDKIKNRIDIHVFLCNDFVELARKRMLDEWDIYPRSLETPQNHTILHFCEKYTSKCHVAEYF